MTDRVTTEPPEARPPDVTVTTSGGTQVAVKSPVYTEPRQATATVTPPAFASEPTFWGMGEAEATLLTGAIAGAIAVIAIVTQRTLSVRQATLEFIRLSQTDAAMSEARQLFISLANSTDDLAIWAKHEKAQSKQAQSIRLVLNEIEMAAVGIQRGILDDRTYRLFWKIGTIRTIGLTRSYIEARRERSNNPSLYKNAVGLAKAYEQDRRAPGARFYKKLF